MTTGTNSFYQQDFITLMGNVLGQDLQRQLELSISQGAELDNLYQSINAHAVQLGIDSFRNCYILDGKTGKSLYGSNEELAQSLEISPNIIAAMSGRVGESEHTSSNHIFNSVIFISSLLQ